MVKELMEKIIQMVLSKNNLVLALFLFHKNKILITIKV